MYEGGGGAINITEDLTFQNKSRSNVLAMPPISMDPPEAFRDLCV